jgi:hypothetical protein
VMNAVGPALRRHGVVVVPMLEDVNYRDVQTSTGKASRECTVKVRYRFHGPAGDFLDCVTPGESMDFGDKGAPKAMSVAYRIALLQALCLPTDDNDPDASNYERAAVPAQNNGKLGQPTADLTEADVARAKIRKACVDSKWDLTKVAGLFEEKQGVTLKEATNVKVIDSFREWLFAQPRETLVSA